MSAQQLLADDDAVTAVEYGLLLALIALVIIAALMGASNPVLEMYELVRDKLMALNN